MKVTAVNAKKTADIIINRLQAIDADIESFVVNEMEPLMFNFVLFLLAFYVLFCFFCQVKK